MAVSRVFGDKISNNFGMQLHLESLKPVLGLKMICPFVSSGNCCQPAKSFFERRALEQHFKNCRMKNTK